MAILLKFFVGLVALFCIMQFVEMAPEYRLRRDAPADPKANTGLSDMIDEYSEKLKGLLTDDTFKKALENAANAFSDGSKAIETKFGEWKEKFEAETKN